MKVNSIIMRSKAKWEDYSGLLDTWIRQVTAVLSGEWTIADQAKGEVKTVRWNSDLSPLVVALANPAKPAAIIMLNAGHKGADAFASGATIEWEYNGKSVSVVSISGLTASTDYDVTLWMVGG